MKHLRKQLDIFEQILATFETEFPKEALAVAAVPLDDTVITLPPTYLHEAVRILVEDFGFYHLSAISGDDTGDGIHLLYHFWHHYGITLRVHLPYDALSVPTLTTLLPGATFYEREIYEMFGVTFAGHPNLEPLLSPDDWQGEHMLRK